MRTMVALNHGRDRSSTAPDDKWDSHSPATITAGRGVADGRPAWRGQNTAGTYVGLGAYKFK